MRRSGAPGSAAREEVHANFSHRDTGVGVERLKDGGTFGFPIVVHMARVEAHHGQAPVGIGLRQGQQGVDAIGVDVGQQQAVHAGVKGAGHAPHPDPHQMRTRRRDNGRVSIRAMRQNYAAPSASPPPFPPHALVTLDRHGQDEGQAEDAGHPPDPPHRILQDDEEDDGDEDDRGQFIEEAQPDGGGVGRAGPGIDAGPWIQAPCRPTRPRRKPA